MLLSLADVEEIGADLLKYGLDDVRSRLRTPYGVRPRRPVADGLTYVPRGIINRLARLGSSAAVRIRERTVA